MAAEPSVNRLRILRQRSRLSLSEVAKILECSPVTISRYESGERHLSPELIRKFAQLFKCQTYELFVEPQAIGGEEVTFMDIPVHETDTLAEDEVLLVTKKPGGFASAMVKGVGK